MVWVEDSVLLSEFPLYSLCESATTWNKLIESNWELIDQEGPGIWQCLDWTIAHRSKVLGYCLRPPLCICPRAVVVVVLLLRVQGIFVCGHWPKTQALLELFLFFLFLFLLLFLFTFWLIAHLNEMKKVWLTWESNLWPSDLPTVTLPPGYTWVKKLKYSRRPWTSIGRLAC